MLGWNIPYKYLMERDVPRLSPHISLGDALQAMLQRPSPALPVVDVDAAVALGVVHSAALAAALRAGASLEESVLPFMDPAPPRVGPEDIFVQGETTAAIILVEEQGRLAGALWPAPSPCAQSIGTCTDAMQVLFSAIPTPVVAIDDQGIIRLCNEAMEDLFPESRADLVGRPLIEVIHGSQLLNTVKTGQPERWQRLNLNNKTFLANRSPLVVHGLRVGALASLYDISDFEEISDELKSVRLLTEELDGIIEASSDGIYVADGNGKTLRVNKAYERITGLRREDVLGFTMPELVEKNVFDQSATVSVLQTGQAVTLIQKISTGATVMVSGTPLCDGQGNIERVVTTVRDLTELNRLRDELNTVGNLKTRYEEELRELKKLKTYQDDFVVHSAPMRAVLDLALRLGAVDSTVLIQGESGVGKEVIAELIHRNSPRHDKPFIKINCTAIPENLLESELFGYARGAFTGANKEGKIGLFEAACEGTLLLDEVGDLPLALQVKLLRVIQEKQVRRIGDNTPRSINVRLLASTNRDLRLMLEQKLFREDLYYRLNVVPLHVPPLRERKEDIVFMVRAFLHKFCERHRQRKELHPSAMPFLLEYGWPGNVRELENLVERIVVTSSGSVIMPHELPEFLLTASKSGSRALALKGESLKEILDHVETQVLHRAFAQHKTTRKVAESLGIDQSSVVRKARRLGLRSK